MSDMRNEQKKNEKGNLLLVAVVIVLAVLIGIFMMREESKIPSLTEEQVQELVILAQEKQMTKIREKWGIDDLRLEVEFENYEYTKPSIGSDGSIIMEDLNYYYVSADFDQFDTMKFNDAFLDKYHGLQKETLPDIFETEVEDHQFYVGWRSSNDDNPKLRDTKGNEYDIGWNSVVKNGKEIYRYKSSSSFSSSSSSRQKCPSCKGTGRVMYYAGLYDAGQAGPCTMCNSTGYVN